MAEGENRQAKQFFADALQSFRIVRDDEMAATVANKIAILESSVTYDRPNHGMYLSDMFCSYLWAVETWGRKNGQPIDDVKSRLKKLSSRHFYCDRFPPRPTPIPGRQRSVRVAPRSI